MPGPDAAMQAWTATAAACLQAIAAVAPGAVTSKDQAAAEPPADSVKVDPEPVGDAAQVATTSEGQAAPDGSNAMQPIALLVPPPPPLVSPPTAGAVATAEPSTIGTVDPSARLPHTQVPLPATAADATAAALPPVATPTAPAPDPVSEAAALPTALVGSADQALRAAEQRTQVAAPATAPTMPKPATDAGATPAPPAETSAPAIPDAVLSTSGSGAPSARGAAAASPEVTVTVGANTPRPSTHSPGDVAKSSAISKPAAASEPAQPLAPLSRQAHGSSNQPSPDPENGDGDSGAAARPPALLSGREAVGAPQPEPFVIAPEHHRPSAPDNSGAPSAPQFPGGVTAIAPLASVTSAASAAAVAAGVPIEGIAIEIATRASEGKRRFEIRLDPPELGRIDVRLDVARDGQVTSRLVVERADTLDLLRRDSATLERALQSAGLRTDDSGLQFSLRDQSGGRPFDRNDTPRPQLLIVPDEDVAVREAVQRAYGALRGLGRGIDMRI